MLTPTLRHLFPGTLAFSLLLTLAACGGSSGGGPGPRPQVQEDTSPAEFSFEAETGVEPGATVKASSFSVDGINVPVTVSVDGGEYAVNGNESFTSESSEVRENDKIVLQATAPDEPGATKEVTLTIGDTSATWAITTLEDTEAPEAAFAFPPPMTATDAETLTVRGTSDDDYSAVASVTLTVEGESGSIQTYAADTENDFEGWSKTVSLEQGDNQIRVSAEDAQGNAIEEADVVQVSRQPFAESFPDNEVPFTDIRDVTFDEKRNRILVPVLSENAEGDPIGEIVSIDYETSERSVFFNAESMIGDDSEVIRIFHSITIDPEQKGALLGVGSNNNSRIVSVDLDTAEYTTVSRSYIPETDQPTHHRVVSIVSDPKGDDHTYTLSSGDGNLLRINLNTGERTVVSSSDYGVGTGDDLWGAESMVVMPDGKVAYASGSASSTLFRINLTSGDREIVDIAGFPFYQEGSDFFSLHDIVLNEEGNKLYISTHFAGIVTYHTEDQQWGTVREFELDTRFGRNMDVDLHLDEENRSLLFADPKTDGVYALDLDTKEYVIVSKSVN
ncbi:hypothetical protein [Marinimicrobium locisalis]|uniref:hypothetical protein n=1 Tax=Marinimicrobium locisalis TaxID=546022 RepID=UPI0032215AE6